MTYKTVLVHLDSGSHCERRAATAARVARAFDAHLVGLFALSVQRLPGYLAAEAGSSLVENQRRILEEQAKLGEALFTRITQREGITRAEYRSTLDDAVQVFPLHARYADLVILGQPDPEEGTGVDPDVAERIVLTAGRPTLIVPFAGEFETLGKRVLVAWNAGREATRAVTDAIPFLRLADKVRVIAFNPRGRRHGDIPGADIGLYLARHGLKVEVTQEVAEDVDVGNQLLSRSADFDADLIVMGAYGHSRLAELVLGGVTRTVFESMTAPVLMSH